MKSSDIPLNQRHFGLHSTKKAFKNYERLETFKVVFEPAIFACACCTVAAFSYHICFCKVQSIFMLDLILQPFFAKCRWGFLKIINRYLLFLMTVVFAAKPLNPAKLKWFVKKQIVLWHSFL